MMDKEQLREALSEDNTEVSQIETRSGMVWDGVFTQSNEDARLIFKAEQAHLKLLDGIEGLYRYRQTYDTDISWDEALDAVMKLMEG